MDKWILVAVLALAGGTVGFYSGIPLGTLLGSLFAVGGYQFVRKNLPTFSYRAKKVMQSIIGGSIGLAFTTETFNAIQSVWKVALLAPIAHILLAAVMTWMLHRLFHFDIVTSFCSSAPAGMSEVTIISEEFGAQMPIVILVHTIRVIAIVVGVPLIVLLF